MCLRPRDWPEKLAPGRAAFLASFGFAWQGITYVLRTQRNARIHLAIACLVLAAAILLRLSAGELATLLLCMMMVFTAEMMNTVVEAVVDLVTLEYHPGAKIAKDVAAGAVLVSAGGAVLVGMLIFAPHLHLIW